MPTARDNGRKGPLSLFRRLASIPHDEPGLTPANWCERQPCLKLTVGAKQWVISQPLSSFWVYFLGLFCLGVAVNFFYRHDGQHARLWWGVSLLLWGIGALLAGTSYQAFGYEIKCAGRENCRWTSWWEVVYLICQQVSVNALLVAVAVSCTEGRLLLVLCSCAGLSSLVYLGLVLIGAIVPIRALITFEFMLWTASPVFFLLCVLNGWRYLTLGQPIDLVLLGSWMLLLGSLLAYWGYRKMGLTEKLWARGLWFSDNDVLHLWLILWLAYVLIVVTGHVVDGA